MARDDSIISVLFLQSHSYRQGDDSEEETQNFPTEVFPSRLFVIHDATGSGHDDEPAVKSLLCLVLKFSTFIVDISESPPALALLATIVSPASLGKTAFDVWAFYHSTPEIVYRVTGYRVKSLKG